LWFIVLPGHFSLGEELDAPADDGNREDKGEPHQAHAREAQDGDLTNFIETILKIIILLTIRNNNYYYLI
jgi:hypothetical protein